MPACGAVVVIEGERLRVAVPALYGLAERGQVLRGDGDEGRRAGPAVQVLVGAADREIHPPRIQFHR